MSKLKKLVKKVTGENGFSLIEVLMSTLILLAVFTATYQILPYPKQRVIELEQKAEVVRYLDQKITEYKNKTALEAVSKVYCNNACDVSVCGTAICSAYTTALCGSSFIQDSQLDAIIAQHKTMCFVRVSIDPNCDIDATLPANAKQVCAVAKWPKPQKTTTPTITYEYEALTAFIYKP